MADLLDINYAGVNLTVPEEHVELTQAEYDALSEAEKKNGKVYFITDGINSNVVLNEWNDSKAFLNVDHNAAAKLYRAQIVHKDAAGNYISAINMDYRHDPATDTYSYPMIEQYRWDETLTADNKWARVAQYLPVDEDTTWADIGVLTGGTVGRIYAFRRNEWISFALRNTIPIDVPAKTHTVLIENMPERYTIKNGTLDFTIAVSPSTGVLIPAILRFTHGGSGENIVNNVTIWSEQALTKNVSGWFGCITYPAMPRT